MRQTTWKHAMRATVLFSFAIWSFSSGCSGGSSEGGKVICNGCTISGNTPTPGSGANTPTPAIQPTTTRSAAPAATATATPTLIPLGATPTPGSTDIPGVTVRSIQLCDSIFDGGVCVGEHPADFRFQRGARVSVLIKYEVVGPLTISMTFQTVRPRNPGDTQDHIDYDSIDNPVVNRHPSGVTPDLNWDDAYLWGPGNFQVKFFVGVDGGDRQLVATVPLHAD